MNSFTAAWFVSGFTGAVIIWGANGHFANYLNKKYPRGADPHFCWNPTPLAIFAIAAGSFGGFAVLGLSALFFAVERAYVAFETGTPIAKWLSTPIFKVTK